jgi:hypothetical protein
MNRNRLAWTAIVVIAVVLVIAVWLSWKSAHTLSELGI